MGYLGPIGEVGPDVDGARDVPVRHQLAPDDDEPHGRHGRHEHRPVNNSFGEAMHGRQLFDATVRPLGARWLRDVGREATGSAGFAELRTARRKAQRGLPAIIKPPAESEDPVIHSWRAAKGTTDPGPPLLGAGHLRLGR